MNNFNLAKLVEVLEPGQVRSDDATLNRYARSTGSTSTRPAAVVYPTHRDHVTELVKLAGREPLALHPLSRGRNWGYGDACAPTSGQIIVDLSRMNRIREVNDQLAYAVIEPGVTQGQLYQHLQAHHPGLMMDANGAGLGASIVGNVLERGFGHSRYGERVAALAGLEAVLADGRILRTGFGHYENAAARHAYRHGIGPSLDGLFVQSNLAIVTQMTIWLMPRPEALSVFFFSSEREEGLEELVDRLAPLRQQGILQSAIHIGNDLRLISSRTRYPWKEADGKTPLPPSLRQQLRQRYGIARWTGCGTVAGTRETVAAAEKAVSRALKPYRPLWLNDRKLQRLSTLARWLGRIGRGAALREQLQTVQPIYGLQKGIPTDQPLNAVLWRVRDAPEHDTAPDPLDMHAGLMWMSPVLPLQGQSAREVAQLIEPIYERYGFEALLTFTMVSERAMICVSNMSFDRRDEAETARAAECSVELHRALRQHGYHPYRTDPSQFAHLHEGSTTFWDVVSDLKRTLDPHNIISPGRYQPKT